MCSRGREPEAHASWAQGQHHTICGLLFPAFSATPVLTEGEEGVSSLCSCERLQIWAGTAFRLRRRRALSILGKWFKPLNCLIKATLLLPFQMQDFITVGLLCFMQISVLPIHIQPFQKTPTGLDLWGHGWTSVHFASPKGLQTWERHQSAQLWRNSSTPGCQTLGASNELYGGKDQRLWLSPSLSGLHTFLWIVVLDLGISILPPSVLKSFHILVRSPRS